MRGAVLIKAGQYDIGENVRLSIRPSDDGTVITIDYLLIKKRAAIAIDEHGEVVWRAFDANPPLPKFGTLDARIPLPPTVRQPAPGKRTQKPAKRIKFIIKWTAKYKPRNSAFVLGAYTDTHYVHILFRVSGGFSTWDGHICLYGDDVLTGKMVPEQERLSPDKYDEFLNLPDNSTIALGRRFRKMALEEIKAVVEGRVLQVKQKKNA